MPIETILSFVAGAAIAGNILLVIAYKGKLNKFQMERDMLEMKLAESEMEVAKLQALERTFSRDLTFIEELIATELVNLFQFKMLPAFQKSKTFVFNQEMVDQFTADCVEGIVSKLSPLLVEALITYHFKDEEAMIDWVTERIGPVVTKKAVSMNTARLVQNQKPTIIDLGVPKDQDG